MDVPTLDRLLLHGFLEDLSQRTLDFCLLTSHFRLDADVTVSREASAPVSSETRHVFVHVDTKHTIGKRMSESTKVIYTQLTQAKPPLKQMLTRQHQLEYWRLFQRFLTRENFC